MRRPAWTLSGPAHCGHDSECRTSSRRARRRLCAAEPRAARAAGGGAARLAGASAPSRRRPPSRQSPVLARLDPQDGQTARSAYAGSVTGAPHWGQVSGLVWVGADILVIYRP